MHYYIELLLRYGGGGFWVVISIPDNAVFAIKSRAAGLRARFEHEFKHHPEVDTFPFSSAVFGRRVLEMPVEDACLLVGETLGLLANPRVIVPNISHAAEAPQVLSDSAFHREFLSGSITPWRHRDYLRAAYLTLMEPCNRGQGLLDVATKFASNMNNFRHRNFRFLLLPESR